MSGNFSYRQSLKEALAGAFGSALTSPTTQGGPGASNGQAQAECAYAAGRRRIVVPISDAGTAATVMALTPFFWAESWLTGQASGPLGAISIAAIEFLPQLTVAVAATNYYTATIWQYRAGAQVGSLGVITSNTGGTATTALTPVAMPAGTLALPVYLQTGDVLVAQLAKTGTGAAISSATGACYVAITIDEL
jgi:hypothetical protein